MTTERKIQKEKNRQETLLTFKANDYFASNLSELSKAKGRSRSDLIKSAIQSMYLDYLQAHTA